MSTAEAEAVIRDGSGSHFDPSVARLLLEHLQEALALRA
jgi:HD-GYP domain-containing protein (c-di-GMP phosphodiesterase class II)